jgi:hypothetical protein
MYLQEILIYIEKDSPGCGSKQIEQALLDETS